MPTFNQLVHTGREVVEKKAKAPALLSSEDRYPEEAELCSEKDCKSPSVQWAGGYRLYSRRGPQPAGAQCRHDSWRPC